MTAMTAGISETCSALGPVRRGCARTCRCKSVGNRRVEHRKTETEHDFPDSGDETERRAYKISARSTCIKETKVSRAAKAGGQREMTTENSKRDGRNKLAKTSSEGRHATSIHRLRSRGHLRPDGLPDAALRRAAVGSGG